jgi:hypothetical protein
MRTSPRADLSKVEGAKGRVLDEPNTLDMLMVVVIFKRMTRKRICKEAAHE